MWISKKRYEELEISEKMRIQLSEEVTRLAEKITEQVKDCRVGPWCKDCMHYGRDKSVVYDCNPFLMLDLVIAEDGVVQYCKKHLHEICPEWEEREK